MALSQPRILTAVLLTALMATWAAAQSLDLAKLPPPAKKQIDFARDIQPLLAKNCIACHGADKQTSGLRLDRKKAALLGGDGGRSIIPGKSAASRLIHLVAGLGEKVMPPVGERLTAPQVGLLRAWIDQGANWPTNLVVGESAEQTHWSFRPVARVKPPRVKRQRWVRNPIDAFILRKLEEKGIKPAPEADKVTLIRRLSLDLTGLPPSIKEVDAFLKDRRKGAYDRLVTRLLASPHYGERWGRHWLDGARYADSNGYTIDSPRQIWRYRDWVIEALNQDMAFDQFTIEQIAGDMLPNATQSQIIATGFHRNTMINEEGGTDDEQFRVEAVADRVQTTGAVFLGLTLGCARCHSHKFDPITQREYYQLFAFLNNCDEPTLSFPTPEQTKQQQALKSSIVGAEKELTAYDKSLPQQQAAWERRLREWDAAWTVLDPVEFRSAGGATITKLPDGSLLVGGEIPDSDTYTVTADLPFDGVTAIRLETLTHDSIPGGGPGLTPHGNFVLNEFEVSADKPLALDSALADFSQKNMNVSGAIDGDPKTGWGIYTGSGEDSIHTARTAMFVLSRAASGRLTFTLKQNYSGARYQIGRFRLAVTRAPRGMLDGPVSVRVRELAATPTEKRSQAQRDQLLAAFRDSDTRRAKMASRLAKLKNEDKTLTKAIPTTMVLRQRAQPRVNYVHIRGDFLRKGDVVQPGVPASLPSLAPSGDGARLDFARWLVDPRNPLTPRVTVNRIWQRYFGVGIVSTENDFGSQGARPTHPELLDWLAGELLRQKWSLKAMHRLIVTSATYRQSSRARPELQEVDSSNALLSHQTRLRLEAEAMRDAALTASGLLSRKIGGPSVYPPQPGNSDLFTQVKKNWKPSEGEDRYRRGMYTFFWRSNPHALLVTFDAPNATTSCTRRTRSNTPLGALMLANDAGLLELAQGLAARVLQEEHKTDKQRVRSAFRHCLARKPARAELKRLTQYLQAQLAYFAEHPKAAKELASAPTLQEVDPAQAAAWTSVARVLMNLDEFITRE